MRFLQQTWQLIGFVLPVVLGTILLLGSQKTLWDVLLVIATVALAIGLGWNLGKFADRSKDGD